ncbi:MAG: hypothetical protein H0X25_12275 [Acidobacteriales bacterium]|nr:hypothetical protein [Terriglobales bacterium]
MKSSATALCLATLCLAAANAACAQISSFQHVIIVVQENRTPDNLFYGLCQPPYGDESSCSTSPTGSQYNIQAHDWLDNTSPTGVTQPTPVVLNSDFDLGHLHHAFVVQCNADANGRCRMDGAAAGVCSSMTDACTTTPNPHFKYVDNSTGNLNPYLDMATQYGWANYMFQTHQGGSYAGHQFIFGGTAAPTTDDDHLGNFVSDNGNGPSGNAGCLSPTDGSTLVQLIDANGNEPPSNKIYPCFEHDTVADLLQSAGVTWRYYSPGNGSVWTAPTSIDHLCQAKGGKCTGQDWVNNVDVVSSDVLTDIANCNLRQVSWVMPSGFNSDHAGNVDGGGGPAWVASIVNAIGNSWSDSNQKCDYWGNNTNDSTAIIVTWDDWGGWYDHEPPVIMPYPEGGYQRGFRVPMLAISAYTPAKYVTNNRFEFGSVIRFVEQNYGIPEGSLTFSDARARSDLKTFFNLNRIPRPFVTIASPHDANYFRNDTRPQSDPDDD